MPAQDPRFPSLPPPAPPPSTLGLPPPVLGSGTPMAAAPPPLTAQQLIRLEAEKVGVPPELALAVAEQESSFNPAALGPPLPSGARAIGTFQILPETAKMFGGDPTDPHENIRIGVKYLRQLLDRYQGDPSKALATYGGVVRDTKYVPGVLARMQKYLPVQPMASHEPPGFWASVADSFDPHERQGRQNLAGMVGSLVGGTVGFLGGGSGGALVGTAAEPGVGTVVGAGGGAVWGQRLGSAGGAAAMGALEQALVEETPVGDWLSKNLPWGTQDEPTPPPDPTSTYAGRVAGAAVNQGVSDLAGQVLMKPVSMVVKRGLQTPIAKAAAEKLGAIHEAAAQALADAKLALTQRIRGVEQAGTAEAANLTAAQIRARAALAHDLAVTSVRPARAGVVAARDAAREGEGRLVASHDVEIDAARARAAAAVGGAEAERDAALAAERAAHQAILEQSAPSAPAAGKRVADVFENAAQVPRRQLGAAVDEAAASGPFKDIRPLQAEAARIEKELPTTFPNQRAAAVVAAIKNESPITSFQRLHELKQELQDSLSGVYDKAARSQMEGVVVHLTKMIRETLSGYAPYDLATQAYRDVMPRYSSQLAKTIRRAARTSPEDIAQLISIDKPTQARFLTDLMTTAAAEGGDAAGGRQALEAVQDVWFYKHVLEGDLKTLDARLADLKRNPEFLRNFLGDDRMKTIIKRAEELARSYPEIEALHAARIAAAKETGEAGVATATQAKEAAVASHKQASTAEIRRKTAEVTEKLDAARATQVDQRATQAAERVRLNKTHADLVEELRQQKETGTSSTLDLVTEALRRLNKSTLGGSNLRAPQQVLADLIGAMRPTSVFSGLSRARFLIGATDADLARFVVHSKLPVKALTSLLVTGPVRPLPLMASHGVKMLSSGPPER